MNEIATQYALQMDIEFWSDATLWVSLGLFTLSALVYWVTFAGFTARTRQGESPSFALWLVPGSLVAVAALYLLFLHFSLSESYTIGTAACRTDADVSA